MIAALAKLPARRREAIVLRYWLDLPEREIAAAMGVSAGTVKSQISRGMAALGVALSLIGVEGKVVGFWGTDDSTSAVANVTASGPPAVENVGGSW